MSRQNLAHKEQNLTRFPRRSINAHLYRLDAGLYGDIWRTKFVLAIATGSRFARQRTRMCWFEYK